MSTDAVVANRSLAEKLRITGGLCVCFACLVTPLSTSLLGLFTTIAGLCWLLSGSFRTLWQDCKSQPALSVALFLFALMTLAIAYSPADTVQALDTLKKYRELLFLPIVYSLMCSSAVMREKAETCLVCGCILLLAASYMMAAGIIPAARYGNSPVFHITHSFFMAILAFWSLHRVASRKSRIRWYWLFILAATIINLFYIAPGRTGMFVFICLMLLFFLQRFSLIKVLIGIALLITLVAMIYKTSDNFSRRVDQVVLEVQYYQPGQSRTSIGQRFDWWKICIELIKQRPLLGHGTGSFSTVQQQHIERYEAIKTTDNPHNEYLFIAVQFGLIGLFLFVLLIALQLRSAAQLEDRHRHLLQGTIVALLSGCLMNSLLFDSQQGHFYLLMSSILMAGNRFAVINRLPDQHRVTD